MGGGQGPPELRPGLTAERVLGTCLGNRSSGSNCHQLRPLWRSPSLSLTFLICHPRTQVMMDWVREGQGPGGAPFPPVLLGSSSPGTPAASRFILALDDPSCLLTVLHRAEADLREPGVTFCFQWVPGLTDPLNIQGELRISVLPAYLSYDAPWPVRKIPLRCTAHYVAYHVESKV